MTQVSPEVPAMGETKEVDVSQSASSSGGPAETRVDAIVRRLAETKNARAVNFRVTFHAGGNTDEISQTFHADVNVHLEWYEPELALLEATKEAGRTELSPAHQRTIPAGTIPAAQCQWLPCIAPGVQNASSCRA